jgi:hypothetical protein
MSWESKDRYFDVCPICGEKSPQVEMITLKKANRYNSKILTRICKKCYPGLLECIGISDVDL